MWNATAWGSNWEPIMPDYQNNAHLVGGATKWRGLQKTSSDTHHFIMKTLPRCMFTPVCMERLAWHELVKIAWDVGVVSPGNVIPTYPSGMTEGYVASWHDASNRKWRGSRLIGMIWQDLLAGDYICQS